MKCNASVEKTTRMVEHTEKTVNISLTGVSEDDARELIRQLNKTSNIYCIGTPYTISTRVADIIEDALAKAGE